MNWFQAIDFQVGFIGFLTRIETSGQQYFPFIFPQQEVGPVLIILQCSLTGQLNTGRDIIPVTFGSRKHTQEKIQIPRLRFEIQFSRTADTVGKRLHRPGNIHPESTRQFTLQLAEKHRGQVSFHTGRQR